MSEAKQEKENPPLLKKRDVILAVCFLAAAGIIWGAMHLTGALSGTADRIEITVDGGLYGTYSLLENQEILIETDSGMNLVMIKDGSAYMEEADCPDGYCIDQGSISRIGETIVCLPHKLVVYAYASDGTEAEIDSVSQ